ncbi:MAG: P-II family nitrogen regulator [Treponema sp.]|jgi:nitrogen regulatory protein PII 2|nr:P-II family nitrogen regulator [Treponema sp.]
MKLLIIIIRHEKYAETKKELEAAGFSSYSSRDVLGRGNIGFSVEVAKKTDQKDTVGSVLYSKKMLEICVTDKDAEQVMSVIVKINHSGHHGDGKIFVLPVRDVIRIRTAEKGDNAIL